MNWKKVSEKLRAISDQYAKDSDNAMLFLEEPKAARLKQLSEIFYGLHAAIEAGLDETAGE